MLTNPRIKIVSCTKETKVLKRLPALNFLSAIKACSDRRIASLTDIMRALNYLHADGYVTNPLTQSTRYTADYDLGTIVTILHKLVKSLEIEETKGESAKIAASKVGTIQESR